MKIETIAIRVPLYLAIDVLMVLRDGQAARSYDDYERRATIAALWHTDGHQEETAKMLGVSKKTLIAQRKKRGLMRYQESFRNNRYNQRRPFAELILLLVLLFTSVSVAQAQVVIKGVHFVPNRIELSDSTLLDRLIIGVPDEIVRDSAGARHTWLLDDTVISCYYAKRLQIVCEASVGDAYFIQSALYSLSWRAVSETEQVIIRAIILGETLSTDSFAILVDIEVILRAFRPHYAPGSTRRSVPRGSVHDTMNLPK